jgi:hypothetical protein
VERLEEVALYLAVASDGVGGGRRGVVAGAVEAAAAVSSDGGAPAVNSGWARAGEVHRSEEEPMGRSAWSGRGRRRGSTYGRLPAAQMVTAAAAPLRRP